MTDKRTRQEAEKSNMEKDPRISGSPAMSP